MDEIWAVVHALWPDRGDNFSKRQHERLAKYLNMIVSDLHSEHGLPEGQTRALLKSVISLPDISRSRLTEKATTAYGGPLSVESDVAVAEAVVRCWTMTKIRMEGSASSRAWTGDKRLKDVILAELESLQPTSQSEGQGTIDDDLTAACLKKYQRVRIVWTSNIAQHLELNRRGTITLKVFEHKIWVYNQLTYPDRSIVPKEVLEELMRTLNLLFPVADPPTRVLLEKDNKIESIWELGNFEYGRAQDLSCFKYWRRNIEALDALLNEPQTGFRQIWHLDRGNRNLMNVLLFWISGIIVLAFTLASFIWSIDSANVQIKLAKDANALAKEANALAREAYALSVAQACADSDVRDKLPQYCD